jgi:hypothetical protein
MQADQQMKPEVVFKQDHGSRLGTLPRQVNRAADVGCEAIPRVSQESTAIGTFAPTR